MTVQGGVGDRTVRAVLPFKAPKSVDAVLFHKDLMLAGRRRTGDYSQASAAFRTWLSQYKLLFSQQFIRPA